MFERLTLPSQIGPQQCLHDGSQSICYCGQRAVTLPVLALRRDLRATQVDRVIAAFNAAIHKNKSKARALADVAPVGFKQIL